MANQAFTKISAVANQIDNLTVSNNLRVSGTTIAGPIEKTLVVPVAIAAPSDSPNNLIKITPEQSGTTFIITQSDNSLYIQTFVLPPAAIGLNYTFIVPHVEATGAPQFIMPYGYTVTGGNPTAAGNGVAEAYGFGIQVVITIGRINGTGYEQSATKDDSINTVAGVGGVAGGISFTAGMAGAASLKLTCVGTSVLGTDVAGVRWIGNGQAALKQDIDVTS